MILVVFEVTMKPGAAPAYFDLAAALRPELDGVDGFLSVERFQSLVTEGKYLSLSAWRDEAAVQTWRANLRHRAAQDRGKTEIFAEFRIRVAEVLRDYDLADRVGADRAGAASTS